MAKVGSEDTCDPCGDSDPYGSNDSWRDSSNLGSCNSPDSRPRGEVSLWSASIENETFIQSGCEIGNGELLVSSNPEASESQASTHMYNCRRARFGAPAWAILQWSLRPCFEVVSWWSLLTTSPRQPSNRPQPRPSSRLTDNHRRNRSVQDIGQGYGLHSRNTTIGHISAATRIPPNLQVVLTTQLALRTRPAYGDSGFGTQHICQDAANSQSSGSTRESARRARTENTYYW